MTIYLDVPRSNAAQVADRELSYLAVVGAFAHIQHAADRLGVTIPEREPGLTPAKSGRLPSVYAKARRLGDASLAEVSDREELQWVADRLQVAVQRGEQVRRNLLLKGCRVPGAEGWDEAQ